MLFRAGAVVVGLAIGLGLVELAVRIFLFRYGDYIDRFRESVAKEYGGELTLRDIVRTSADRQKCYELIPGAWGTFAGQPLRINSAGFRDREHTRKKTMGTFRVAILGDSVAFGWGVKEEERFSNVLEAILNSETSAPLPRAECLNFAVPGYNSVMEEALLQDNVFAYEPDVVVVNLVTNDDEVPNFVRLEPRVWDVTTCFLIEAIRDKLGGRPLGDTARLLIGGIAEAGGRGHANRVIGYRPELVPPEYRFLVGWDNMVQALRRMCQACHKRHIQAYCLLHYDIRALEVALHGDPSAQELMRPWRVAALQAGFVLVDPLPEIVGYAKKKRIGLESFVLSPRDIHPSPLGHRLIAETLAKQLLEERFRATNVEEPQTFEIDGIPQTMMTTHTMSNLHKN
ncbi:MAG: SGNH/GDSL hydrolase family protein [Candidatus Sumerlaeaceae bacterium]